MTIFTSVNVPVRWSYLRVVVHLLYYGTIHRPSPGQRLFNTQTSYKKYFLKIVSVECFVPEAITKRTEKIEKK